MSLLIALLLQALPAAGPPRAGSLIEDPPALQATIHVLPRCPTSDSAEEIVVCGRADRRDPYRLEPLDPRFEKRPLPDGRFVRSLSDTSTLEGGGPKGSVGLTLRTKF